MPGIAIITESCIDTKIQACVDVCPVQCISQFGFHRGQRAALRGRSGRRSREHPRDRTRRDNGISATPCSTSTPRSARRTHATSRICTRWGRSTTGRTYGKDRRNLQVQSDTTDPNKGHDHTFFTQLCRDVFAD